MESADTSIEDTHQDNKPKSSSELSNSDVLNSKVQDTPTAPPHSSEITTDRKYYRRPERSIFSLNQKVVDDIAESDKIDINTAIDESLPQDDFTVEDFTSFWNSYMSKLKNKDKPLYNVLGTANWRLTNDKNIELTFDSSVMILEFEKSKEDFIKKVRKKLNNYGISIRTKINKTEKIKNHIKSRREIYEDLVKMNPALAILKEKLELDIDNEPD